MDKHSSICEYCKVPLTMETGVSYMRVLFYPKLITRKLCSRCADEAGPKAIDSLNQLRKKNKKKLRNVNRKKWM